MTTLTTEEEGGVNRPTEWAADFARALYESLEELGDRFGFYEVMCQSGPLTPAGLATRAGISEACARLWLQVRASGQYLVHDPQTDHYSLWCTWPALESLGQ